MWLNSVIKMNTAGLAWAHYQFPFLVPINTGGSSRVETQQSDARHFVPLEG